MNKLVFFLGLCILALFASCDKDDSGGKTVIDSTVDCNTITYSGTISSIVSTNCAISGCHSNGAGIGDFTTYNGLMADATNGKMASEVLTDQTMPPAGPLSSLQLGQIQCWLNAGAPDN